jgi:hypothetical protein
MCAIIALMALIELFQERLGALLGEAFISKRADDGGKVGLLFAAFVTTVE